MLRLQAPSARQPGSSSREVHLTVANHEGRIWPLLEAVDVCRSEVSHEGSLVPEDPPIEVAYVRGAIDRNHPGDLHPVLPVEVDSITAVAPIVHRIGWRNPGVDASSAATVWASLVWARLSRLRSHDVGCKSDNDSRPYRHQRVPRAAALRDSAG